MRGPRGPQKCNGMTKAGNKFRLITIITIAAPVKFLRGPCGPRIFLLGLRAKISGIQHSTFEMGRRKTHTKWYQGLTPTRAVISGITP